METYSKMNDKSLLILNTFKVDCDLVKYFKFLINKKNDKSVVFFPIIFPGMYIDNDSLHPWRIYWNDNGGGRDNG